MGNLRIIIDHDQIEYEGPVNVKELIQMIQYFVMERGFDMRNNKDFEHHTDKGTQIEWEVAPWKVISEYARHIIKVRILGTDLVKVDAMQDKKKIKIDKGKLLVVIDAFVETDVEGKWTNNPLFVFIRTIYDNFIYRIYTERFEQRLIHDANQLSHWIKRYLNINHDFKLKEVSD